MPTLRALGAAGAAAALLHAAPAGAATLKVDSTDPCLENNVVYPLVGSGFTPNSTVNVSGLPYPTIVATDESGAFVLPYRTPDESWFKPRTVTLYASDATDPAIATTTTVHIVRFGSNVPVFGKPGERVNWHFAGFPGTTIYGHFRHRGRTIRNFRFGKAQGVCGTLIVRAPRLPTQRRRGTWTLQIDGRRFYSQKARPAFRGQFEVS